jgi:hypothetical protein
MHAGPGFLSFTNDDDLDFGQTCSCAACTLYNTTLIYLGNLNHDANMLAMPRPWTQTVQLTQAEATNAEVATTAATSRQLCIASYNIRYDSKPDTISVKDTIAALPNPLTQPKYLEKTSEQPWSARRILVAEKVLSRGVDILCKHTAVLPNSITVLNLGGLLFRCARSSGSPGE